MDEKLELLLADVLQINADQINDDLAMTDLDAWDSLKHMELITGLEQAFDVQLSFDEIVSMRSVREIKRVLAQRSAVS